LVTGKSPESGHHGEPGVERSPNLLIVGASTRAAAFSALRAGLDPWCADLFADADLEARCPVIQIARESYPRAFTYLAERDLPGAWMYTGRLEHHPDLVDSISGKRPLWGNRGQALRQARQPKRVAHLLHKVRVAYPAVRLHAVPREGRWLIKPLRVAGSIRFAPALRQGVVQRTNYYLLEWLKETSLRVGCAFNIDHAQETYFQEFIEGEPCAAVYASDGRCCNLLGMTRQIVGAPWLHAGPFQYCGSVGPIVLQETARNILTRAGASLAFGCHLYGLFGVDCILRDGVPLPVEVNPRYTASVEVLEYGAGMQALALHRAVFEPDAPPAKPQAIQVGVVGKGILFARAPLVFPDDGPWSETLRSPSPIEEMPDFADIPHAGDHIDARRPILTFFTRAATEAACLEQLKGIAADLDRWLFER
jgi:predicted ATP-grasp superfamily ATP-dependent carboligase